ncbi:MAG: hypothetical protein M0R76_07715, partial [Proteobacteria bacterium]|nr:hypothetical protein [Pseudomonadota bacterium]
RGADAPRIPRFENLEGEQTMLAETLGYILDERHEKGLQEGLQKGREEGLRLGALSILLRQVEMKFGTLSDTDKTRLSQLNHDQVTRALSRILTATTLEEIL